MESCSPQRVRIPGKTRLGRAGILGIHKGVRIPGKARLGRAGIPGISTNGAEFPGKPGRGRSGPAGTGRLDWTSWICRRRRKRRSAGLCPGGIPEFQESGASKAHGEQEKKSGKGTRRSELPGKRETNAQSFRENRDGREGGERGNEGGVARGRENVYKEEEKEEFWRNSALFLQQEVSPELGAQGEGGRTVGNLRLGAREGPINEDPINQ